MTDEEFTESMTDEFKLRKDTERATAAQGLLDNAMLNDAFASLEAAYIQAWRSTHVDESGAREKLFLAVNIIGKVKEHLGTVVANGNLAAAHLRSLVQTSERQKSWADSR